MPIWDDFTDDELFTIIESDKLRDIKRKFRRKFNKEAWIAAARNAYAMDIQLNLTTERLFYSVNDATSYSFLLVLFVIGSITVALIPLSIMTAVLAAVGLTAGPFFYVTSYRQHKREREEECKEIDFNAIKNLCADEIIRRKKQLIAANTDEINLISPQLERHAPPPFNYKLKYKAEKVRPAVVFGLLTASVFFGPYFSGIAILLNAFGLVAASAAMLGPIGISVGLAAAIVIGITLGIMRYRSVIKEDKISQFKDFQHDQFIDKRLECYELAKITNNLAPQPPKLKRTASLPPLQRRNSLFAEAPLETATETPADTPPKSHDISRPRW